ncbi:MAG TPA: hypothetical protein P5081_19540 [Phycisphaerae bacterium]|nr:hypothetical protein [Phycisphaerae bacterium]HRW55070.1 hypothetical protein [Phycisphaerae bacterium]
MGVMRSLVTVALMGVVFGGAICQVPEIQAPPTPALMTTPPVLTAPPAPVQPMRVLRIDDSDRPEIFAVSCVACPTAPGDATLDCGARSMVAFTDGEIGLTIVFLEDTLEIIEVRVGLAFAEYRSLIGAESAYSNISGNPPYEAVIEAFDDDHIRGVVTGSVWVVNVLYPEVEGETCSAVTTGSLCSAYVLTNTPFRIEFDLTYDTLGCSAPGCID